MILSPADLARCNEICGCRRMIETVAAEISEITHIPVREILSSDRKRRGCGARDMVCFIVHREGFSRDEIGQVLGRDKSSVGAAIVRERARRGA